MTSQLGTPVLAGNQHGVSLSVPFYQFGRHAFLPAVFTCVSALTRFSIIFPQSKARVRTVRYANQVKEQHPMTCDFIWPVIDGATDHRHGGGQSIGVRFDITEARESRTSAHSARGYLAANDIHYFQSAIENLRAGRNISRRPPRSPRIIIGRNLISACSRHISCGYLARSKTTDYFFFFFSCFFVIFFVLFLISLVEGKERTK